MKEQQVWQRPKVPKVFHSIFHPESKVLGYRSPTRETLEPLQRRKDSDHPHRDHQLIISKHGDLVSRNQRFEDIFGPLIEVV